MGESDLEVISLLCYGAASLLYSVGTLKFLGNQVLVSRTGCNCVKDLETHSVKLIEVQYIAAEHVSILWSVFCWNRLKDKSARESRCPCGSEIALRSHCCVLDGWMHRFALCPMCLHVGHSSFVCCSVTGCVI